MFVRLRTAREPECPHLRFVCANSMFSVSREGFGSRMFNLRDTVNTGFHSEVSVPVTTGFALRESPDEHCSRAY